MKRIIFFFATIVAFCAATWAQDTNTDRLFIAVVQPDREEIPAEAAKHLENKMQQMITANGIVDNALNNRFVITAKAIVNSKNILPTTPQRVQMKVDFVFMVGDVIENKVFDSYTVSSVGVGTNENKAYISAIQSVKPGNPGVKQMLDNAKQKILDFYAIRCDQIKNEARLKVADNKYDEAIFLLMQIPDICDCAAECQELAMQYYGERNEYNATVLLREAKGKWAAQPNKAGAEAVRQILEQIPLGTSHQSEVDALVSTVENKLRADEAREWSFKVEQHRDRVAAANAAREDRAEARRERNALWSQAIGALRDVGVAFGQNQKAPFFNSTRSIVRRW